MNNEIIFLAEVIFVFSFNLVCFLLGKKWLFSLVCAEIILMNIFVLAQFSLFGFDLTGGNVLYAAIFLSTDMVSEIYGKKSAKNLVKMGFLVTIFFVIITQIFTKFSPNQFDGENFDRLKTIFQFSPRIFAASMISYLFCQFLDISIFHIIRKKTAGKFLWLRNLLSTGMAQFLDSIIFTFLGLVTFSFLPGVIPLEIFWQIAMATFVIKFLVAILDTPFIYLAVFLNKKINFKK